MTHYTSDQLAVFPWIVSSDTLRAEDLLPRFWTTAEQLAQVLQERIPSNLLEPLTLLVGEDSSETDWNDDLAADTLAELFDLLQSWAPAGFSFGSHEGDGACFGFWLTPDWCDALEVLGFGNDDPAGWSELITRLEADGLDPDSIEDAYQGRAEGWSAERAGADYAQQLAQDSWLPDGPGGVGWNRWPVNCIDWDAAWRELEMGDGYRLHDIGGGEWLVFRAV
jgi:hypothetical protein